MLEICVCATDDGEVVTALVLEDAAVELLANVTLELSWRVEVLLEDALRP